MVHIGVEFEGFVVSVEFEQLGLDDRPSDADIIKAAREEMIDQIKDAPDSMFTIEDEDEE